MFRRIRRILSIELLFMKTNLLTMMEYKASYFLSTFYELAETLMNILYFYIIFMQLNYLVGWNRHEMFFLMVFAFFIDAACTMFYIGMTSIPDYIRTGTLDLMLLKPVNKKFLLTFRRPNAVQIINVAICAIYFAVYFTLYKIGAIPILLFVLTAVASVILMYCVMLLIVSLAFWFVSVGDMWNITYTFNSIASRPSEIYPKLLRSFMVCIIPAIVIINYPVKIVLKKDFTSVWVSLFVTAVFFILSDIIFKKGLKAYTSAGG